MNKTSITTLDLDKVTRHLFIRNNLYIFLGVLISVGNYLFLYDISLYVYGRSGDKYYVDIEKTNNKLEKARKKYAKAVKYFLKGREIENNENNINVDKNMQEISAQQVFLNKALKLCNEIKRIDPGYINAFVLSGEIYTINKDYDKAYNELENAIKLNPNSSWVLKVMGNLYFKRKDYGEAEKYYLKAIKSSEKDENTGWIYHDLAQIYMEKKDIKKACETEKKALEYLPDNLVINDSYTRLNSMRNNN
ncbi:MAG: tetratricopeptide repeat protein [Elusimicrobia bacterium]|nr:tetratricopeptide repeat protein [Candidatus Liberimonas magnetica]